MYGRGASGASQRVKGNIGSSRRRCRASDRETRDIKNAGLTIATSSSSIETHQARPSCWASYMHLRLAFRMTTTVVNSTSIPPAFRCLLRRSMPEQGQQHTPLVSKANISQCRVAELSRS